LARNSIFKAAGFCFKTSRGIGAFGNAGCLYDNEYDVPSSQKDVMWSRQFVGHMVTSAVTYVFGLHCRLDCESKPEEARKSGTLILP
jgi:YARHG domain